MATSEVMMDVESCPNDDSAAHEDTTTVMAARAALDGVTAELAALDASLVSAVLSAVFEQQHSAASSLDADLVTLASSLSALEGTSPDLTGLLDALAEHSELARRVSDERAVLELAREVAAEQDRLKHIEGLLDQGQLTDAVNALLSSSENGKKGQGEVWNKLRAWEQHLRATAHQHLVALLALSIQAETGSITLRTPVSTTPATAEQLLPPEVMSLLDRLDGSTKTSERHLRDLATSLLAHLVLPVLRGQALSTSDLANGIALRTSSAASTDNDVLGQLTTVLLPLLAKHTALSPPSSSSPAARFAAYLAPLVRDAVVDQVLRPKLPVPAGLAAGGGAQLPDYEGYGKLLDAASELEQSISALFGAKEADESVLQDFVEAAGPLWAQEVRERAMGRVRELVWDNGGAGAKSAGGERWQSTVVEFELPVEEEPEPEAQPVEERIPTPPPPAPVAPIKAREPTPPLPAPMTAQSPPPSASMSLSHSISSSSSFLSDTGDDLEPDDEEEDAWGLGSAELPAEEEDADPAVTVPPPAQQEEPAAEPAEEEAAGDDAEDAWGFGEEEEAAEEPEPETELLKQPAAVPEAEPEPVAAEVSASEEHEDDGGEDGWGLDADPPLDEELVEEQSEEEVVPTTPPPVAAEEAPATPPPAVEEPEAPSKPQDEEEDGWGFGDEEEASILPEEEEAEPSSSQGAASSLGVPSTVASAVATPSRAQRQARSAAPSPASSAMTSLGASQGLSEDSWAWQEEDEGSPVKAKTVNGKAVNGSSSSGKGKEREKIRTEKMTISRKTIALLEVLDVLATTASDLLGPSASSSSAPDLFKKAAPVLQLPAQRALWTLYRATSAVPHLRLLESVPAIGMQYSNDLLYLSSSLDARGEHEEAALMREQAEDWRERCLKTQRAALAEELDECAEFEGTDGKARSVRVPECEQALGKVVALLQQLAGVWKPPVMRASRYWETMGMLVDEVLGRVLLEMGGKADISEAESQIFTELCTDFMQGLERVFPGPGGESEIGLHVPSWYKFKYFSELLTGSMVDILYLFDNGHLVDFTPDELARLIRALFSESPARTKNIAHILKGHPTVVLEEDDGF